MGQQDSASSKIILFLDDAAARAAKFCEQMTPHDQARTIWCKTAEEAIITIRDYYDRIDLMLLDHDLGIEEQNFRSPESGMEVVRYLKSNVLVRKELLNNNCRIIIHSWNAPAARIMTEDLRALGFSVIYKPFGS